MTLQAADARQIKPNVFGWLDQPIPPVAEGRLVVAGWVFSSSSAVTSLTASISGRPVRLQYGLHRPDVAAEYPLQAMAAHSGFIGIVDFETPLHRPAMLTVFAALEDGQRLVLFKRPLAPHPIVRYLRRLLGPTVVDTSADVGGRGGRPSSNDASARELHFADSRAHLRAFFESGRRLDLRTSAAPQVSIVVVLWNRAELTLRCLESLCLQHDVGCQVIVVDNASTDDTARLLSRVSGAIVVGNLHNLGFTTAANIGARQATGEFLVFVNSDMELLPGCIGALVDAARRDPAASIVGGKLVFPSGKLQEAGSVVWTDGSCDGYGRNDDPSAAKYNFEREVDFCSGALLLVRRSLFDVLAGFDEAYRPAYYEDVDLCTRAWQAGHRVLYQPAAVAVHCEFGSAISSESAIALQLDRRAIYVSRHQEWLRHQHPRTEGMQVAKSRRRGRRSVLVIDDSWPEPSRGSGFPRADATLRALVRLDCIVTSYPMDGRERPSVPSDELARVEVLSGHGPERLRESLVGSSAHDVVIVSRPHNLQLVLAAVGPELDRIDAPVVYDAEAVYASRELARLRLKGVETDAEGGEQMVARELQLARGCAAILAVNECERDRFLAAGFESTFVLGHAVQQRSLGPDRASRKGLLFVGAIHQESPNEDAVLYLIDEVLPAVVACTGELPTLTIAGAVISERVIRRASEHVRMCVGVPDLQPLYHSATVFVAPTRYSAGIPLKLLEAAAFGVPIVCTSQLAAQIGWRDGLELLVGDTPGTLAAAVRRLEDDDGLWTRVRMGARARLISDASAETFTSTLAAVLGRVFADETQQRGHRADGATPAPGA